MSTALQPLLDLLDLEPLEVNLFRGRNHDLGYRRVFGGQVLAQALIAAGRTVETDWPVHSLHAYFILPGDVQAPIVYQVDRLRDGGSFTTRRVTAIQHGRPIFNAAYSFHRVEEGLEHQAPVPEVPGPDGLPSEAEMARAAGDLLPERLRANYAREQFAEFRPVRPLNPFAPEVREPVHHVWVRTTAPVPGGLLMQQAALAYASDYGLLGAALLPHGRSFLQRDLQAASLDHALWFHRPFEAHEWLLYTMESPSAAGALGFTRGTLHTRAGRLVASVAQEGLIRLVDPAARG
ncbi:MAG TPA: acyl-CoA thioesterase II [Rubricoccaceae bacterium]|nr:acyl-CoA thioesterase II [Rubricoccaceae bacterium]